MKLKKVISLVLGGVMALSMLTACGGTEESSTLTESNVTVASGVVDLVQAYMATEKGKDEISESQTAQTLAGSESTHKAYALEKVTIEDFYNAQYGTDVDLTICGNTDNKFESGKTYYVIVSKESLTSEAKIAEAIEDALAALKGDNTKNVISKMSVFEATVTGDYVYSYSIDGTALGTTGEYWVIVFTCAKDSLGNTY